MNKRRMIHDCLWRSESFASLTMQQRILWVGLITTSDDQGRGLAHPGLVRAAVFPFDVINQDDIKADLSAICSAGMMTVYQVEGREYYQVLNWWEYQTPQWAGPSDYPPPDGWDDRLRYHGAEHKIVEVNWKPDDKAKKPADKLPSKPALQREEGRGREEGREKIDIFFSELKTEWLRLLPDKPQPRTLGGKNIAHLKKRMESSDFMFNWIGALDRASRSTFLNENGFFTLWWFILNDDNWQKCLDGNYDDKGATAQHKPPQKRIITLVGESEPREAIA